MNLRATIQRYLDLLNGDLECANPERTLARLLDELAVAVHGSEDAGPWVPGGGEAPSFDYHEARGLASRCFPDFGYYQAPSLELFEELAGDAIDDLADLYNDLTEVLWLWDHDGEATARWMFHWGFENHWGEHMRLLQWYLQERREPEY